MSVRVSMMGRREQDPDHRRNEDDHQNKEEEPESAAVAWPAEVAESLKVHLSTFSS
jgi:hypothetical protein